MTTNTVYKMNGTDCQKNSHNNNKNDHPSTMMGHHEIKDESECVHDEHATLRKHPYVWAAVGVSQTFFTAIMFGWASLVPVLRSEGTPYTPTQLSQVFTAGAVGNYLATLPFGMCLDWYGPKTTGCVASILYAIGLLLCAHNDHFHCFLIGFGLIGLSRPGIQLPTLHLANLFDPHGRGGAVYMSAQAAAFDAGTAVFALFHTFYYAWGVSSKTMFTVYTIIPVWTMLTAIFVWPHETLEKVVLLDENGTVDTASLDGSSQSGGGTIPAIGSPYMSPKDRKVAVMAANKKKQSMQTSNGGGGGNSGSRRRNKSAQQRDPSKSQVNAPLSTVLTHVSFYSIATWVGIHIYKLNYIVATINDQLKRHYTPETADELINILGIMLPFGFVVLPIVATMLHKRPMLALQVANTVGCLYGAVMTYLPHVYWLQILVIFPAVATSRQLVYSTLFHTIGQVFGFANYGVLLGLTNAIASIFQTLQTPMVDWSENQDSYFWSNWVLLVATIPLLGTVLYSDPTWQPNWLGSSDCCSGRTKNKKTNVKIVTSDDTGAIVIHEGTSLLSLGNVHTGDEEVARVKNHSMR